VTHYLRRADRAFAADQRAGVDEAGASRTRSRRWSAAAAPPAAVIEGMSAWASTSRTSTGSPRPTDPARCAEARRMDVARHRRAHRAQRAPGRALTRARGHDGDGPGNDARSAVGRRDDGRDHVPRQHHDEGLPQEPQGQATRRLPEAGSIPATSR
jgi:hypothetical protein